MTPIVPALLCLISQVNVELTTLDGESHSGPLTSWTQNEIVVGETVVAVDSAHRISFREHAVLADESPVVYLQDGSRMRVSQVVRTSGGVSCSRGEESFKLSSNAVAAIRFAPLQERFVETWADLLERERRDDLFARVRGESLDYVACILGDMTETQLSLRAGGRDVKTKRENAFGVLFASTPSPTNRVAGKLVHIDGSEFIANSLNWSEAGATIKTASGVTLTIPSDQIASVDLAFGRVTMLRDLEPRSVTYAPFGDNYDEYAWHLRKDHNALDQRLTVDGKTFATGLWMHSGTTATFALPARTRRLQAVVGIDELDTPGSAVRLEVRADGRSVFNEVIDPTKPREIDLDLSDVRSLVWIASTLKPEGHGIREHLAIVRARLILE